MDHPVRTSYGLIVNGRLVYCDIPLLKERKASILKLTSDLRQITNYQSKQEKANKDDTAFDTCIILIYLFIFVLIHQL